MAKGLPSKFLSLARQELAIAELPNWFEPQNHNLNCQSFKELSEAIVQHLGKSRIKREKIT